MDLSLSPPIEMVAERTQAPICVLGCGVIGLTTALRLATCGYPVTVLGEHSPQETVSAVAAAFWTPYHVEGVRPSWARQSLEVFRRLEATKAAGVQVVDGVEYFESEEHFETWMESNWWRAIPAVQFKRLPASDLPPGFVRGVGFRVPVIHMPTYLRWLEQRALRAGITIHHQTVGAINDLSKDYAVVVNATGLGAHRLVGDPQMYALRGQVVCVKPLKFSGLLFMTTGPYENEPAYLVRRITDLLLGGTTVEVPIDDSGAPNPAVTSRIIERCARFVPELASLRPEDILDVKVGLRPCRRGGLRLETDSNTFSLPVVHAYGHGGGGVTLSWGTADEVIRLVDEVALTVSMR